MRKSKILKTHEKILFGRCVRAMILMMPILCAGCERNTAANDFCAIYSPIYADFERDTPETARQIDWNNAAFDVICDK
ncbi:MAG: hypothetical protein LBQ49_01520 [Rickettsiales bacterium]|nr:hypothetical protein [Rickettsiales bacterium]